MKSIFEELWNGNITPCKTCGRDDSEMEELAELLQKNKVSLDNALGDKQKKLLHNYMACNDEYHYLMTVHAFQDGFSLAGKLLSEALREQ